jgi:hypothetical protein
MMSNWLKSIRCLAEALAGAPDAARRASAAEARVAELEMELLKAKEALKAQQPTFMWGVTLGFFYTDENFRMAEYDSPGERDFCKVHSIFLTKDAAEDLCAKFNRFIRLCKGKINPNTFSTELMYAEVIRLKPGERILDEGDDPTLNEFKNCGIEALWKKFLEEECKDEPEQP